MNRIFLYNQTNERRRLARARLETPEELASVGESLRTYNITKMNILQTLGGRALQTFRIHKRFFLFFKVGRVSETIDKQGQAVNQYLVNFIGDNSHNPISATLPRQYVYMYEEKYEEFGAKAKQRKLKESIAIANDIQKGKTTYNVEMKRIETKKLSRRFHQQTDYSSDQASESPPRNSNRLITSPNVKRQPRIQKKDSLDLSSIKQESFSIPAEVNGEFDSSKNLSWRKDRISSNDQQNIQSSLDIDSVELLQLLLQPSMSLEKLNQKLKQVLQHAQKYIDPHFPIEVLSLRFHGNTINALYILFKKKVQKFKEHPLYKDLQESITSIQMLLTKLEQRISNHFFDPQIIFSSLPSSFQLTKQLQDNLQGEKGVLEIEEAPSHHDSNQERGSESENDVLGSFPKKRYKNIVAKKNSKQKKVDKKQFQKKQEKTVERQKSIDAMYSIRSIQRNYTLLEDMNLIRNSRVEMEMENEEQETKQFQKELNQQIYEKQQLMKQQEQLVDQECQYADRTLRKRVCQKLAKVLEETHNLNKVDAKSITVKLESLARSVDNSMKGDYRTLVGNLIQNLAVENLNVPLIECNCDEIFEKLSGIPNLNHAIS